MDRHTAPFVALPVRARLPFPYRLESDALRDVRESLRMPAWPAVVEMGRPWVQAVRERPAPFWALESLLREYPISSAEGLALMRLAEALRVAGLPESLANLGLEVLDRGNLAGPGNPWRSAVDGYRHIDEVIAWNQAVHDGMLAELRGGRLPILLGGDHCLGIGSISAVARHCREANRKLRVLWLDSHADFNTNLLTPSGNVHGMPVACLCGHGPKPLTEMSGAVPAINTKSIRLMGIRSVDPGEKRFVHEAGLEVFDMRFIDEMGMRHAMELALATIDAHTHLHVSFDVDFLDPDFAPGVATTVRGGPTYREAQLCMEMIADTGALASLDVMELNPALDVRNRTAEVAVDLIESLFGKSTLMRKTS